MNRNEYLVFGNSGKLGKYDASDQDHPQDIIDLLEKIFKSRISGIFKNTAHL